MAPDQHFHAKGTPRDRGVPVPPRKTPSRVGNGRPLSPLSPLSPLTKHDGHDTKRAAGAVTGRSVLPSQTVVNRASDANVAPAAPAGTHQV
jgi:hypothetical protein